MSKLSQFFGEELINLVTKVDIQQNLEEDILELKFKLSGKSVSALSFAARYSEVMQNDMHHWFFRLKLNTRFEVFVWRLCMNAIPTIDYLFSRRLADSNLCPRGCFELENIDHCTATCPKLIQVIILLKTWRFPIPYFRSFSECMNKLNEILVRYPILPKCTLFCFFIHG
ncbi:hypothetical protein MA16_Dca021354 [Dendrobium catenatum]|uniref:Reverse transcriptase zinc-binding domain-containing protein n=1 Tax=Dendrobium catenatum TaxID=906689 RepID=A0A2I0X4W5_9ASPA|nr:hypothetical protein MA16_Dca021354 [Dendrobium catenatum]